MRRELAARQPFCDLSRHFADRKYVLRTVANKNVSYKLDSLLNKRETKRRNIFLSL